MSASKTMAMGAGVLLALTLACSSSSAPTSPTAAATGAGSTGTVTALGNGASPAAGASLSDAVTLKVTAPTTISPVNNQKPDVLVLTATASVGKFATVGPLQYRFLIIGPSGSVVQDSGLQPGPTFAGGAPTETDKTHTWVVRAEYQGMVGPWSTPASFIASTVAGYIRGGELYDPLVSGVTIGEAHGVTFIPGVGARLDDRTSYIQYQLQQPVQAGEFSVLATNIGMGTDGLKTKVMSMSSGLDDLTTNSRRFTIEKRGSTEGGAIAWRVIANDGAIETIGNERIVVNFSLPLTYLWRATWDSTFHLTINEGGAAGPTIYDFQRALLGTYDPNPQYVFLGSPPTRSGPDSQSVPGIIIRQVWVSKNPRPAFANR